MSGAAVWRGPGLFFRGRGPWWALLAVWVGIFAVSLLGWFVSLSLYGTVDGTVRVDLVEVLGFVATMSTAWLLAPRMTSWEAAGTWRSRWWGAGWAGAVGLGGVAVLAVGRVYAGVAWSSWLPRDPSGGSVGQAWVVDRAVPTQSIEVGIHLAIIAGLVFVCVGAFGRVAGFLVGLGAWIVCVTAPGQEPLCQWVRYSPCLYQTEAPAPTLARLVMVVAVVVAVIVLVWAGGGGTPERGVVRLAASVASRFRRAPTAEWDKDGVSGAESPETRGSGHLAPPLSHNSESFNAAAGVARAGSAQPGGSQTYGVPSPDAPVGASAPGMQSRDPAPARRAAPPE